MNDIAIHTILLVLGAHHVYHTLRVRSRLVTDAAILAALPDVERKRHASLLLGSQFRLVVFFATLCYALHDPYPVLSVLYCVVALVNVSILGEQLGKCAVARRKLQSP